MVSPFIQPDFSSQTETELKTNYDNAAAVFARGGGAMFAPSAQTVPDLTVKLLAGHVWNGQSLTEVGAQNTAAFVAPISNPRIDRIEINRLTGTLTVLPGVEAGSPSAPAYTRNAVPICRIALAVAATEIANADITDERDLGSMGLGDIAHGIDALIGTDTLDLNDEFPLLKGVTAGDGEQRATLEALGDLIAVTQASRAAVEAETDENTYVPPDLIQHSPGVAKVLLALSYDAGTPQIDASKNIASLDDDGTGAVGVNFTTAFSSADYAAFVACVDATQGTETSAVRSKAAGAVDILIHKGGTARDFPASVICLGDQ